MPDTEGHDSPDGVALEDHDEAGQRSGTAPDKLPTDDEVESRYEEELIKTLELLDEAEVDLDKKDKDSEALKRLKRTKAELKRELKKTQDAGDGEDEGRSLPSVGEASEAALLRPDPAPMARSHNTLLSELQEIPPEPEGWDASYCPAGYSQIVGSSWSNSLWATQDQTCAVGLEGHDDIHVLYYADESYVLAGPGYDYVSIDYYAEDVVAAAGSEDDYIWAGDYGDIIWAQDGNDIIFSEYGADYVACGNGDDRAYGSLGADELIGGEGNDVLVGESHNDRLVGGPGDDVLIGDGYAWYPGDDTLIPGPGRDEVWGDDGNDTVIIYDVCELSSGWKYLNGGWGNDTLILPIPLAEAQALGLVIASFEEIEVQPGVECLADCTPDCPDGEGGNDPVILLEWQGLTSGDAGPGSQRESVQLLIRNVTTRSFELSPTIQVSAGGARSRTVATTQSLGPEGTVLIEIDPDTLGVSRASMEIAGSIVVGVEPADEVDRCTDANDVRSTAATLRFHPAGTSWLFYDNEVARSAFQGGDFAGVFDLLPPGTPQPLGATQGVLTEADVQGDPPDTETPPVE